MITLVIQLIFIASLGGIVLMMVRKIPMLLELSEVAPVVAEKRRLFKRLFKRNDLPKVKHYKAKELKEKTAILKQDKKHQIDKDADYWQNIGS